MTDATAHKFNSHAEFEAHLRDCLGRARVSLTMFDPDFSVFPLGSSETDALLRQFLAGGGAMRLAMHRSEHIERHYPRFVRLLREFNHRIEVRATPRSLHHLTDSFCIADGIHIVRRFHSDHMRGEAAFDAPAATELSQERFGGIWVEAVSTLHPTTTGL
ncbi:hypothetical protein HF313_26140 [Massilia atriviolacea]|uniref:DUF7931 domain-containing protein n=1 Tax=Massilia atriviolacea TaxID=2495579 RepID=A0A430HN00_9BURK|nr:hypothetical protein [Massilia atriviolacea]RSZ58854.1 hypothetical protein EJB06_10955 [Massilia atriviolacea]